MKTLCCDATLLLDKPPGVDYTFFANINSPKEDFSMDPKQVTKQTFDFYKSIFDNTYNAMAGLQEQGQKTIEMFLNQTQGFPEECKKVVQEWIKACKKGSQDFKAAVDENFKKVEDFFAEAAKSVKEQTQSTKEG